MFLDKEFQKRYQEEAEDLFALKSNIAVDNSKYFEKVDMKEVERAMDILVEAYKRVKHGQKEVTLNEVLESVKVGPYSPTRKLREITEESQEAENEEDDDLEAAKEEYLEKPLTENQPKEDLDQYFTNSVNKIPSLERTHQEIQKLRTERADRLAEEEDAEAEDADDTKDVNEETGKMPLPKKQKERPKTYFDELEDEGFKVYAEQFTRYVPGFRHYENFDSYSIKHPDATIDEYVNEMNREVTFAEYLEINKTSLRMALRVSPQLRMEVLEMTEGDPARIEWVFNSEEFEEKLREEFSQKMREYLGGKVIYKLVDCLEEYMDMLFLEDPYKVSGHGAHVPSAHTMIPFPKFWKQ